MTISIPEFPKTLKDIFLKSWISYKKLFYLFLLPLLCSYALFVVVFFALVQQQELLIKIYFIDFITFLNSKLSDAFACFILPIFLQNKIKSTPGIIKKFLKEYFIFLILLILFSYTLQKFFENLSIISILSLILQFYLLFAVYFVVLEKEKGVINAVKSSFKLVHKFRVTVLLYFISCYLLVESLVFLIKFIIFFDDINQVITNLTGITEGQYLALRNSINLIVQSPKFFLLNSAVDLIFKPFISIFLAILFYSFCFKSSDTTSVLKSFTEQENQ